MPEWKPYLRDRMIAQDPAGFYVIVPNGVEPPVPLSCPLCRCLMRSRDDESSYLEFETCYLCAMRWAHPRREAWKNGWRPSEGDVIAALSERPPILVDFDVD